MKKTLITLTALASVAMAGVDGDWTGSFSWGADSDLSFNLPEEGAPITLTDFTSDKDFKSTNVHVGTYTPNVNIGYNAGTWTLSFTVTNTSSELLDIRAITLGTFLFNGDGNFQYADNYDRSVNFTLSVGNSPLMTVLSPLAGGNNNNNSVDTTLASQLPTTFNLGEDYISLAAGESVTLSITAADGNNETEKGTFVGLSGATFTLIPEPATATLSLLALVGLAARRRRR